MNDGYKIVYVGGGHSFLLIRYGKNDRRYDEEFPYRLRIDYMNRKWKCSVRGRNINEMRNVIFDLYENRTEVCMHLSHLISDKEGTNEGFIEAMQKRELIRREDATGSLSRLNIRTRSERSSARMTIYGLKNIVSESGRISDGENIRILLDATTGLVSYTKPKKLHAGRRDDEHAIFCGDIDMPITLPELKRMISESITVFQDISNRKLSYVFMD